MWSALGKYRAIVVSIALFLFLDASVLTLNFYISYKIADDAVGVNLAGRQRMLTQRTVKSLYELDSAQSQGELKAAVAQLSLSHDLFDQTLKAFDKGGQATGAAGENVVLDKVSSPLGRLSIEEAKILWGPLKAEIQTLVQTEGASESALASAIVLASKNNLQLLKLMNDLTVDLEIYATGQAQMLRYIQTAGITLAIINFLFILFHFLGQLRTHDRKLEEARQETSEILNTVREGLFLLDPDLKLGKQHSQQLSELFGGKEVTDITFSELIGDLVNSKDLDTAERFVALLFKPNIKDNLIKDLNPLDEVEINIPDKDGGYTNRYLSFDFSRVVNAEGDKHSVLVTVTDVTVSVLLAKQLEEQKDRSEKQMEALSSIMHIAPRSLKRFIQNSFDTFKKINDILKDQQSKNDVSMSKKLNDIFIEVHNFKGDSSAMELEHFADLADKFEDDIQQTMDKKKISGNDFLKLAIHLEELIKYTESIQEIAKKLANFSVMGESNTNSNVVSATSDNERWNHLYSLCTNVAEREKKAVQLVLMGLRETAMEKELESLINDICIQCIRNAIVHSIEPSNQRVGLGKNALGRIDIRLAQLPGGDIELSILDDGAGVDYEKIREKAISSGSWPEKQIAAWNNKKLLSLIFEPGFSTSSKQNQDAGRGVGMDVIRNRIQSHKGRIKICSRAGTDCQFTITLPQTEKSIQAA